MDTLLERLRAAAPQTRDQRDRRRRARLKEKHQDRIASGQHIPDIAELTKAEDTDEGSDVVASPPTPGAEWADKDKGSESKDVADRAASLLQGLRGEGDAEGDDTVRVRRRRESADDERKNRRSRRRVATSANTSETTLPEQPSIPEDLAGEEEEEESGKRDSGGSEDKATATTLPLPVTTLSPPTPEKGTQDRPLEISD
jgi:cytokinesis protein